MLTVRRWPFHIHLHVDLKKNIIYSSVMSMFSVFFVKNVDRVGAELCVLCVYESEGRL